LKKSIGKFRYFLFSPQGAIKRISQDWHRRLTRAVGAPKHGRDEVLDVGSTLHQFIHEFVPATVKARQQEDMNKTTLQKDWGKSEDQVLQ